MTAILLGLIASTGWGLSDFLGGVATGRTRLPLVLACSQIAGLAAVGPILLLHGTAMPSDARLLYAVAAGFAGVLELALVYVALEHGHSVVMAPIAALSAVLPVAVGVATGDRIDLLIATGIACALAGAAAAAFVPSTERPPRRAALTGGAIAAGAALCTGAGFVLLDAASAADPWWATGVMHATGTSVAVAALLVTMRMGHVRLPSRVSGRVALAIAAVGLSDVGASVAYTNATRGGTLSVVAVLSSLYPVVTIALGVATLGERPARIQLAGAGLALAGVAILAGSSG